MERSITAYDLFSNILDDQPADTYAKDAIGPDLVYDSELAVVAGSDSTAGALSAILLLLGTHPDKLATLQKEVDDMDGADHPLPHNILVNNPYLNGCINEALRLYPAVMSGSQRETGPQGAVINGELISSGMLVSIPTHTLHRGG